MKKTIDLYEKTQISMNKTQFSMKKPLDFYGKNIDLYETNIEIRNIERECPVGGRNKIPARITSYCGTIS